MSKDLKVWGACTESIQEHSTWVLNQPSLPCYLVIQKKEKKS